MIHGNAGRFGVIRTLVLTALFAIGLVASTAVPALAQNSGIWTTTGSLKQLAAHTLTRPSNGQVLAVGRSDAELYTP